MHITLNIVDIIGLTQAYCSLFVLAIAIAQD